MEGGRVTLNCMYASGADTCRNISIRFSVHIFATYTSRHQEIPILHSTAHKYGMQPG